MHRACDSLCVRESRQKSTELLQKSRTMIEDIFPGISSGISEVSTKADMVYGEVSGLRSQVAQIDNNVNDLEKASAMSENRSRPWEQTWVS